MNILFVCSLGKNRSRTANHCLYRSSNNNDYGGIDIENAVRPVTEEMVLKADFIFFMEKSHYDLFLINFPQFFNKDYSILNIEDNYKYMDDLLVHKLRLKTFDFFEKN